MYHWSAMLHLWLVSTLLTSLISFEVVAEGSEPQSYENDPQCTIKGYCLPPEMLEFDVGEFWGALGCDEIYETPRPLVGQDNWMLLRELYHDIVGLDGSVVSPDSGFGAGVKYHVRSNIPGKGRGVFASSRIPKDTLIWSTKQTARFSTGHHYRLFLALSPAEWACDTLQWAYVQDIENGHPEDTRGWRISVDLDDGSNMNSDDDANTGCAPKLGATVPGGCKENYFALRDIEPGEEILLQYSDFAISDGWSEFGM